MFISFCLDVTGGTRYVLYNEITEITDKLVGR